MHHVVDNTRTCNRWNRDYPPVLTVSSGDTVSLALKDVHLAQQALGDDRFAVLDCLADEWQQAVDQGLGEQDLTVVTRALEQQGGTP